MALVETEALVLRTYNLAEADKIVVCLSRKGGLIRGVARGCRRLKNRFGASLEPFTLINLCYYQRENSELVSLRQSEILRSSFDLSAEPNTLTGLAYIGDLLVEFSPPSQVNDKLFRMVKACLEAIFETPGDLQSILRYFEVWLLQLEGFLPDIKGCADCHHVFADDESAFMSSDFALRCSSCRDVNGRILPKVLHTQLRATQRLAPGPFARQLRSVPAKTRREMADLTQRLIGHITERQPGLRST